MKFKLLLSKQSKPATFSALKNPTPESKYETLPPRGVVPLVTTEEIVLILTHSQESGMSNGTSSAILTGSALPIFS